MGRELRRVPLDFDHPVGQTWPGFLNPLHSATKCAHCDGSGYSPEAKHMHDLWYGYAPFKPEDRGSVPTCAHCDGEGEIWSSPEAKQAYEDWQPTPPPEGGGYQIWETVSEGSPISPVFSTPEDLARHMATTAWGADKGTSAEQWLRFINGPGWAPSMVMHDGVMETGVQAFP